MKLSIEIPEEFEVDFNENKFQDFFSRVLSDIDNEGICGNYEKETAEMLLQAFSNAVEVV